MKKWSERRGQKRNRSYTNINFDLFRNPDFDSFNPVTNSLIHVGLVNHKEIDI